MKLFLTANKRHTAVTSGTLIRPREPNKFKRHFSIRRRRRRSCRIRISAQTYTDRKSLVVCAAQHRALEMKRGRLCGGNARAVQTAENTRWKFALRACMRAKEPQPQAGLRTSVCTA